MKLNIDIKHHLVRKVLEQIQSTPYYKAINQLINSINYQLLHLPTQIWVLIQLSDKTFTRFLYFNHKSFLMPKFEVHELHNDEQ